MDIFVRLTEGYEVMESFIKSYADSCDKLIVYEHGESSRKHIHFYAVNSQIKPDAIKTRIKKYLNVSSYDKSRWSFKTATDDGCIVYMTKGRLEPSYVKGFTQEEVVVYKDRWIERTAETSKSTKSNGPTQYDMAMEVYDMISNKRDINNLHTIDVYELCVKSALKVLHKHRKGFDENSIRKVVQPAYTMIEGCKEQFVNSIVRRFFDK